MAFVLVALCCGLLIPLGVVWWATWVNGVTSSAARTPLTHPHIEISEPGWRFRLPWFRSQWTWLEHAGYEHIGWVDERFPPRREHPLAGDPTSSRAPSRRFERIGGPTLVFKHAVFWNREHRSYALLISVLGTARVFYLAMAGGLLVRTGATERGYSAVGPGFVDGGYRDRDRRCAAHHALLTEERQGSEALSRSDGGLEEVLTLLRARAVRGAPHDPPFTFGEPELAPDDHVVSIPFVGHVPQLFEHYVATFGSDGDIDSWPALVALLVSLRSYDGARIVLRHERYPGVGEESDHYLDALRDAAWWNQRLLVTFDQRPS